MSKLTFHPVRYSILSGKYTSGQIQKMAPKIAEVLNDGSRIDRYLAISRGGDIYLTDNGPDSAKIPVNFDGPEFDPESEQAAEWIAEKMEDLFVDNKWDLCCSETNDTIRKATASEALESWIEGPAGRIAADGKDCYVAF